MDDKVVSLAIGLISGAVSFASFSRVFRKQKFERFIENGDTVSIKNEVEGFLGGPKEEQYASYTNENSITEVIDGVKYNWFKRSKEESARSRKLLLDLHKMGKELFDFCEKHKIFPLLRQNFKGLEISEADPPPSENGISSFTINKKKLSMCLRDPNGRFHELQDLFYVFLHELAHCSYENIGHDLTFWTRFRALQAVALYSGIWKPRDTIIMSHCTTDVKVNFKVPKKMTDAEFSRFLDELHRNGGVPPSNQESGLSSLFSRLFG